MQPHITLHADPNAPTSTGADLIITGGGTGGHVYPALAVAEALKAMRPGARLLYVGTPDRLEARVVPEAGYRFAAIPARGLSRRPIEAIAALGLLVGAVARAYRLLGAEKPRAVLGTGGYVSAPVLIAAAMRGLPVVLQEQNVVPGKVNRFIARFAHTVATSFPGSERYFPPRPLLLVGNPIRPAAFQEDPAAARRALGLPEGARVLLVTGGSQGAARINTAVAQALPRLLAETDWHVYHVTGPSQLTATRAAAGPYAEDPRYHTVGYMEAMPRAILAADLVIGRAGATTLAELTATGKPMILVPYPFAGGHQRLNAEAAVEAGAALEIPDGELDAERLLAVLMPLLADPDRLAAMGQASRALGRPDAAADLAALLIGLAWPEGATGK